MDPNSACWCERRGFARCSGEGADVLLSLADTRQGSDYNCGEAVVACLLDYYRIKQSVKFGSPEDGADPRTIETFLRRPVGLRVVSGSMTIEDLAHHAKLGRPVIALVHWPGDADSHYVCVRGVSRRRIYFQDPWDGPGVVPEADWLNMWMAHGRLAERFHCWGISAWPG